MSLNPVPVHQPCMLKLLNPRTPTHTHTHADVKTSLMELHDLGPCKLFDTAGLDEPGELGAKKRAKVCARLHGQLFAV